LQPGQATPLRFSLTDKATGQPVQSLEVAHEAPVHLIIVSSDLGYFAHVHPEPQPGAAGLFAVDHIFPRAGDYVMYAEFALEGKADEVHRFDVRAGSQQGAAASLTENLAPSTFGDYTASIMPQGAVVAGEPSGFVLNVERGGQPVSDLQPYLGAAAHVVVLDETAGGFAHVHAVPGSEPPAAMGEGAMTEGGEEMEEVPASFGPQVAFTHTFDKPGPHKVWAQVEHDGQVLTFEWVIEAR
jgi:Cu+-exporting ATPase